MTKIKFLLLLIFVAGTILRFADALRPIDHASWREADEGAIARNYVREGMNPFYPRIDWRGNTPGYVEMEFPLYPFLIAATYQIFGVHDYFGRIWSLLFSLGTFLFFYRLAREYLKDSGLICAVLFFTFNPLIFEFSTSIQPEGLMLFCYTASVYFFLKWLKNEDNKAFWLAVCATALTLLAKATAAHIGLFFGVLLLQKFGWQIFKQAKVWIFGAISFFPALLWYLHAKNFWKIYGNSLGVSNEYHWIGWDFFTNSYFIRGILSAEFSVIWIYFGLIFGIYAIWKNFGEKLTKICLWWFAAIFVMYILAARTTADDWANYYHIFAVLPVALLFGFGSQKFAERLPTLTNLFSEYNFWQKLRKFSTTAVFIISFCAVFLIEARQIKNYLLQNRLEDPSFSCAAHIKPALKNDGLILVSGGNCFDQDGYQRAYNASFMFYWLDRKGSNICVEDQSIEKVKEFAADGTKYFVAQKSAVFRRPNFENELAQTFPKIAECSEFEVFDLISDDK